jgi:low temperature requirement protein LtrA
MLWALGSGNSGLKVNFQRIISWLGLAGMLWIAGGLAEGDARLVLWSIALLLEYVAPSIGFWVPGMGRSRTSDWNVEGHHLAERCGLFIIIALGESILVTGATFGELAWSSTTVAAFVVAFVGSVAMWWIYFDSGAERGSAHIAGSSDPGRMARLAYTYLHLPIVAGIIVAAVADELLLAHPAGHADPPTIAAALGGPALFLLGTALFKATTARRFPLSHLVGLVLLALLSLVAAKMATLVLGAASTLVLVLVAAWERRSLRGKSSESAGA